MRWLAIAVGAVVVLAVGYGVDLTQWGNPRVIRELRENPQGERAKKVMLLTLPSGRALPVNYLRDSVFARLRPTAPRFLGTMVVIELD